MNTKTLTVLALVASLAGCATWKHQTASEADFNRDRYQCQMETSGAYPMAQSAMGPGQQSPTNVRCTTFGNQTNCTSTPGVYVAPPTQDLNAMPRMFAFNSCMQARGYYK